MAVAAEQLTYQFEHSEPPQTTAYESVDQSFYLRGIRAAARTESLQILDERLDQLRQGDFDAVPLEVDPLTSVQALIAARNEFGFDSPEATERAKGSLLDCTRLVSEAARKLTWEYFPPLEQKLDRLSGQYISHGFPISPMTRAGLTPIAVPEEIGRRVNENVEEVTYEAVGALAIGKLVIAPLVERQKFQKVVRIRTISKCAEYAIDAYKSDAKGKYENYVPEIDKLMIRDVVFDPTTGDRYEEQVGLSGLHINKILGYVLEERGIEGASELSRTELLGLQMIVDDEQLEFVASLDETAGKASGQQLFMGEPVSEAGDYKQIPAAAKARQTALESQSAALHEYIIGLAESGVDRWAAISLVGKKCKELLYEIAEKDISQAAIMFDQNTARGVAKWAAHIQNGDYAEAARVREKTYADAPAPSYCGAGSCGLEDLGASSDQAATLKEMGLESNGSLKDTTRRCPKCSKKEIVYDMKNKKKACTGCKSTTDFGKSNK